MEWVIGLTSLLALVATGLAIVTWRGWQRAEQARREAQEQFAAERVRAEKLDALLTAERAKVEELLAAERAAMERATAQQLRQAQEALAAQKELVAMVEQKLGLQFSELAQRLLEEKAQQFYEKTQQFQKASTSELNALLQPLRDQIEGFRRQVQEVYHHEADQRVRLAEQVRQLMELNQTLSAEARALTKALKGDAKAQGNWGELALKRLLEFAGLTEGREYFLQVSHRGEEGRLQPDAVVQLPGERVLVIDAKVSLTAYAEALAQEEEAARREKLKAHVESLRRHVRALGEKGYHRLYPGKTLDFVVMFVAVEPAYLAALQEAPELFAEAWQRNVLLVSPSSLLFVLRTVEHLWRQEMQQRNVLAIAQKGAELYDKFAGFVGDMQKIGERLQQTQAVYDEAYKKLTHGRGNLIAQVEQLRKLGVQPKKTLPPALLEAAMEHEEIPVPKASGPSDSSPAVAAHPSFSVANAEPHASAAAAGMPAARSDESTTTVPFSSLPSAEMPTSASALRRKAGGWEHCEDGFGGSEVMGTEVR